MDNGKGRRPGKPTAKGGAKPTGAAYMVLTTADLQRERRREQARKKQQEERVQAKQKARAAEKTGTAGTVPAGRRRAERSRRRPSPVPRRNSWSQSARGNDFGTQTIDLMVLSAYRSVSSMISSNSRKGPGSAVRRSGTLTMFMARRHPARVRNPLYRSCPRARAIPSPGTPAADSPSTSPGRGCRGLRRIP